MLYNGEDDFPEEKELRLSDAFIDLEPEERPGLELAVKVININYGKSRKILERDKTLQDYSHFVYFVRQYRKQGLALEESIKKAINECVQQNIMRDFLERQGSDVHTVKMKNHFHY